jgi:hypothetical protein
VGVALNKNKSLWLDAGILPSYIGFESAISSNNSTLTRSLLAENSPYFFSGAQLTYQASKTLNISGIVLNGWQRIQRLQGNSFPSFGSQIQYTNPKTTLNWSTFIGSDYPDSTRKFRYFNNIYWQQKILNNWEIIAGLDLGCEQKIKNSNAYNFWFSPVLITQYTLATHWKTAFRAEYYSDKNGVLILNNSPFGFKTSGFSINLDYVPKLNMMARIEARWLHSAHPIFTSHNTLTQNNFFITSSLSVKFN